MENNVYVGKCPICRGYGMLEVIVDSDNSNFSVICDECSAEWKNPDDALNNINGYRETPSGPKVRNATIEEIKKIGWENYILTD